MPFVAIIMDASPAFMYFVKNVDFTCVSQI
jgi:hypothetical protein